MKNILKRLSFKKIIFFIIYGIIFPVISFSQSNDIQFFQTLPHLSIRAIEVLNDSTVWFAANHGVWGFTENNGRTWTIDSIKTDSVYPEFRSIALLNDSTVLLMSINSPAYLFKTTDKGKNWRLVYTNKHKDIFFDSMKFRNAKEGIAIGDPVDGCFQIIKTIDGGEWWTQTKCENIPEAFAGEACFAASNTCIEMFNNNVWFATGGKHARVFYSSDFGEHFKAFNTPMIQGDTMTGIYSIDFYNEKTGVVAGGNYGKTDSSITIATTNDGGKTWKEIKTKVPHFGCVQIKPSATKTETIIVTGYDGTFEINTSQKKIKEILDKNGAELKFNTFRFSKQNPNIMWLAGRNGKIARLKIKD